MQWGIYTGADSYNHHNYARRRLYLVHFVGAGPGAEDLITVRGAELLKKADMIIYAGSLVNPLVLGICRKDARLYDSARLSLDEVIRLISEAESENKDIQIVRLHSGDFGLYGAVKEQIAELKRLGIAYDLTPGVSSFNASASVLETEYTPAGISQSVIITRMEGRTAVPEGEKLRKLSSHGASMVIFLSMGLVGKVQEELLKGGAYDANTPVAIVYKVTWKEERVFRCRLSELEKTAKENMITKTALIIVGDFLGDSFETSRLYSDDFTTEYRKGKKSGGIRIIAFTDRGEALSQKIRDGLKGKDHDYTAVSRKPEGINSTSIAESGKRLEVCQEPEGQNSYFIDEEITITRGGRDLILEEWVKKEFYEADSLVFIGALGIAVRAVAPFIESKAYDPAVVAVDETGKHVIPVLSGHIGGANKLSERIAKITGGEAVITTATDLNGKFAVDNWTKEQCLAIINPEKIKSISSAVLKGQEILFESIYPISRSGELFLPAKNKYLEESYNESLFDNQNKMEDGLSKGSYFNGYSGTSNEKKNNHQSGKRKERTQYRYIYNGIEFIEADERGIEGEASKIKSMPFVYIGVTDTDEDCLKLCLKTGVLGVGCRKGVSVERIEDSFQKFLRDNRVFGECIKTVASIDLKEDEEGLLRFCERHGFEAVFYTADQLNSLTGDFSSSEFVKEITGVDCVCERSAAYCSGAPLIIRKYAGDGVTFALAGF